MPDAQILTYYKHPSLGISDRDPSGVYRYARNTFVSAGVDSYTLPPSQNEDLFERLTNIMPPIQGILQRRWGYNLFGSLSILGRRMYNYQRDSDSTRRIVITNTTGIQVLNEDGTNYVTNLFTPGIGAGIPRMLNSRDYAYFVDGLSADLQKWGGDSLPTLAKWGIAIPITAVSVGAAVAGSITLNTGRKYYTVYRNSTTGHYSDLSPVSASTGPLTAKNIPLSNIPVSPDSQVDRKTILATSDGGDETTLYYLADIANATTTLTDNIPEATLIASNVYHETDSLGVEHGVVDNATPPNGTLPTKHRGRCFMVLGQLLYYSKSLDDLTTSTGTICGKYEEAWPADNFFDISPGAESIRGMLSDGQTLWIGTERHIRRLIGDGPLNWQEPEIAFNNVGLLNNETWTTCYVEGQPVGSMWLTPDYRVMFSDFNTYRAVSTPIEDTLQSINITAATTKAWAQFFAWGEFDLYILAIPTGANTECDTLCVYDLRLKKWYIWNLADNVTALLYNISGTGALQWLFCSDTNKVYQFGKSYTQDRTNNTPVSFASTVRTSWLNLGDPSLRKVLNELDLQTGDANLTVTVQGASLDADFTAPVTVVSSAALSTSPFGTYKVYLAGKTSKHRFYRLTFTSPAGTTAHVLSNYTLEVLPWNRF